MDKLCEQQTEESGEMKGEQQQDKKADFSATVTLRLMQYWDL